MIKGLTHLKCEPALKVIWNFNQIRQIVQANITSFKFLCSSKHVLNLSRLHFHKNPIVLDLSYYKMKYLKMHVCEWYVDMWSPKPKPMVDGGFGDDIYWNSFTTILEPSCIIIPYVNWFTHLAKLYFLRIQWHIFNKMLTLALMFDLYYT